MPTTAGECTDSRRKSAGPTRRDSLSLALFSLTLFLSAALLFSIEPMLAKMILPLLGGTTAVWTTCMLFYQAMLLAGYAFAKAATARMNSRWQTLFFVGLAVLPLMILPISLSKDRVPPPERNPVLWLLMTLLILVGLPFFVLSTVTPTLQKWFANTNHPQSSDPYFLYAASNAGSILGLLSYPFLIEPRFRLAEQSRLWAYGYGILVVLIGVCAAMLWVAPRSQRRAGPDADQLDRPGSTPGYPERFHWVILTFVPSSLLLGVTTQLTTEFPPIPMFWVLPLTVYLLSFMVVFAKHPIISHYQLAERMPLFILVGIMPLVLRAGWPQFLGICVGLMMLFVVAVACHGELAKRRPPIEHLTDYYFWIALGGVAGGLFNAAIAPMIFSTNLEFPLVLIVAALLRHRILPAARQLGFNWLDATLPLATGVLALILSRVVPKLGIEPGTTFHLLAFAPSLLLCLSFSKRPIRFAIGVSTLLIVGIIYTGAYQDVLRTQRSFYGIYRIANDETGQYRILFNGATMHGIQSLSPEWHREPLSYYARSGPVGQVFTAFAGAERLRRVGIVGLGAGTMACYAAPGEEITFYEIDPLVEQIGRDARYFTFLRDCSSHIRVVLGDARVSLKHTADRAYNMLILDAFSADAIPVHLLTREALQLYLSKLVDHGILLLHISNRYLDLEKVLSNVANDARLIALVENDTIDTRAGKLPSTWVVMARGENDLGPLIADPRWVPLKGDSNAKVWTDDFSSVLTVFEWN